jgi:hypothetical protein
MSAPQAPFTENPLAPDTVKNTSEFGLKVIKDCYSRWQNGYGVESYTQRVNRFNKNRSYASGKQNTTQYKDIVNTDGQIAVLNIDYSPLPIAVPFIKRLSDRFGQRIEKIRCTAVDPFSQSKKEKAKENERFKMQYGDKIKQIQQNAGMQLEQFSEDDPKDEQELDVKFGFNYKSREEVMMELGLDMINYENNWDDVIKPRLLRDIMCCGYAVTYTENDGSGRIKDNVVKPEFFITSYSEFDDFNNWQYQGQVRFMSIAEVRLRFKGKINESELFDLANKNSNQWGNPDFSYTWNETYLRAIAQPWDGFVIKVVDLHYKTLYNLTYEVKRNSVGKSILKPVKKTEDGKEYEKSEPYYVAYHGVWVIGTDTLLKWELADNMIKPQDNLTEIISPYSIFMYDNDRGTNTPIIESMIPSIDLMHNLHYKSLQLIAAMAPDGADIDVSRLSDIDMGTGVGVVSPLQLYGIFLQTGNRYFMGVKEDGTPDPNPPITPNNFQYSNKLEQLDNKWQREYEKLMAMTGSSNLDAGIINNQATANVTLNNAKQIAASSSNYIYDAYLKIFKNNAKIKAILLWDKLVFGQGKFEGYARALGTENVETLKVEATDDFEKTNFDVKIEAVVDDAEMQKLNNRIDIALANKEITIQDAIELDLIENLKYKAVMLATRAKRKFEMDTKKAELNSQQNTQQAIAAAQETGKQSLALEAQQHSNRIDLLSKQTEASEVSENFKFAGILKGKIVDAILSKPGSTINDIPDFVWTGLNITTDAQKQVMLAAMQSLAMQNQQMQMAQQQQAPQQPQENQQQEDPNTQQLEQVA